MEVPLRLQTSMTRLRRLGPVRLLLVYRGSNAGDYAAALAYHALLTLFPTMLGVLTFLSLFAGRGEAEQDVRNLLNGFPESAQVWETVLSVRRAAGTLGLLAVVGLVFSGTGFFAHLEFALDRIYLCHPRDGWKQRLMGLGMVFALLLAALAAIGVSWVVRALPHQIWIGSAAGWVLTTALLVILYKVVPNRRHGVSESWPGAVLAGFLIQVLNLAFPVYASLTRNLNGLSRSVLLFLLLASWMYLVCQLILLGAALNRMQLGRLPTIGRSHEH